MPIMNTQQDLLSLMKRRGVGKGSWKMTLTELIESEQAGLDHLRSIGNCSPNDAKIQRHINEAMYEASRRLIKLHELLNYRERESHDGGCP